MSLQWLIQLNISQEFAFCLIWSLFFFVSSLLMLISGGVMTVAGVRHFYIFLKIYLTCHLSDIWLCGWWHLRLRGKEQLRSLQSQWDRPGWKEYNSTEHGLVSLFNFKLQRREPSARIYYVHDATPSYCIFSFHLWIKSCHLFFENYSIYIYIAKCIFYLQWGIKVMVY